MILETIGKLLLRRKESRDFFMEIVILVLVNTVQCFSLMILRISFVTFYNYLYRSYTRHLIIKYDHFSRLLLHLRYGEFVISLTDQTFSCKSEREVLVSLSTVTVPMVISFSNRRISVSEVLSGRLQIIFVTALQKNRNLVCKSMRYSVWYCTRPLDINKNVLLSMFSTVRHYFRSIKIKSSWFLLLSFINSFSIIGHVVWHSVWHRFFEVVDRILAIDYYDVDSVFKRFVCCSKITFSFDWRREWSRTWSSSHFFLVAFACCPLFFFIVEMYGYHVRDSGSKIDIHWNRDPCARTSFVPIDVADTMSQSSSFVLNTVLQNSIGKYNIDSVMMSKIIPECHLSITTRFHVHADKLVVSWRRTTVWTRHHFFNCIIKSMSLRNLFHFPFVVIGNRSSQSTYAVFSKW